MSNPNDICARPKCLSPRSYNIHDPERGGHEFVEAGEPHRLDPCRLCDGERWTHSYGQANEGHGFQEREVAAAATPDPDAAVRATLTNFRRAAAGIFLTTSGWAAFDLFETVVVAPLERRIKELEDAFAAGRALGRDEGAREERAACEKLARVAAIRWDESPRAAIADAIARRGKEGT